MFFFQEMRLETFKLKSRCGESILAVICFGQCTATEYPNTYSVPPRAYSRVRFCLRGNPRFILPKTINTYRS